MKKTEPLEVLAASFPPERFLMNEPMNRHTSFQIGGPADAMVMPVSEQEIIHLLSHCRRNDVPVTIMGNGSNLLVKDGGIEGLVIKISQSMNKTVILDEKVDAMAGISLSCLSKKLHDKGLAGFEFASGIPGTLGGALAMNAGAYGGEMKELLLQCTTISREGEMRTLDRDAMQMSYRSSIVQKNGDIITSARLKLHRGDCREIGKMIEDYWNRRLTKQPYNLPSGGSVFKRPEGYYAGKLIEDCGLKGYSVGGAMVSEVHAGFIVNTGQATAADVLALMNLIKDTVRNHYRVELESELRVIGRS